MGHRAGSHPPLHSAEGFGDCTGFYHTVDHSFEGLVSLFITFTIKGIGNNTKVYNS